MRQLILQLTHHSEFWYIPLYSVVSLRGQEFSCGIRGPYKAGREERKAMKDGQALAPTGPSPQCNHSNSTFIVRCVVAPYQVFC